MSEPRIGQLTIKGMRVAIDAYGTGRTAYLTFAIDSFSVIGDRNVTASVSVGEVSAAHLETLAKMFAEAARIFREMAKDDPTPPDEEPPFGFGRGA